MKDMVIFVIALHGTGNVLSHANMHCDDDRKLTGQGRTLVIIRSLSFNIFLLLYILISTRFTKINNKVKFESLRLNSIKTSAMRYKYVYSTL